MRRIWRILLLAALMLLCSAAGAAEEPEAEAAYYGPIGARLAVYRNADEKSTILGMVEAGTVVEVYVKGRTWTRIGF